MIIYSLYRIHGKISRMVLVLSSAITLSVMMLLYSITHDRDIVVAGLTLVILNAVLTLALTRKLGPVIVQRAVLDYIASRDSRVRDVLRELHRTRREIDRLERLLKRRDIDKVYVEKELRRARERYRRLGEKLDKIIADALVENTDSLAEDMVSDARDLLAGGG